MFLVFGVRVNPKRMNAVYVFQRVRPSAGGWEVQLQVKSRTSGVGLCLEVTSVPVVCSATVWIPITSVTVMPTTTNGIDFFLFIYFALMFFN